MPRFAFLSIVAVLAACTGEDTMSDQIPSNVEYALVEMNGAAYDGRVTITFDGDGRVAGQAPCNRYFGQVGATYPAFALNSVGATMMVCEALDAEAAYFAALESMTTAEVSDGTLTLSNDVGETLVFGAP